MLVCFLNLPYCGFHGRWFTVKKAKIVNHQHANSIVSMVKRTK